MAYEHELESELEQLVLPELEVPRGRVQIRYMETAGAEFEAEPFDPSPPPPGTILLTHFPFGRATLSGTHLGIITGIATSIAADMPGIHPLLCSFVTVEGHEDEVGDPARFGALGRARAAAVVQSLVARLRPLIARIPAANRRDLVILVSTAGPTRPIRSNVTPEGRAFNRRVEVRRNVGPCRGQIA
jgi:hypothetical protein